MIGRLRRRCHCALERLEPREMLSRGVLAMLQPASLGSVASVSDDYGNTFAEAAQLSLSSAGSGSQSGKIERAGDVDMFSFVAPLTGTMTIQQAAASGSRLDSYLYVYDANQQLLARNDDNGASRNSRVDINVTGGTTYYVKAAAYQRSTGAYFVQFSTLVDDYGNTFAEATQVSLSSAGSGSQAGKIERAGDVDMFSFVAPLTGTMTIQQTAASGSRLDSYLYVYDANRQLLARNDDNGASRNSRVDINVTAGTTYYVQAAAYQRSTGAYVLQFSTIPSTSTPNPTPSGFQIDVTMTGFSAAQQQVVQQAVDRWEQIIVGDLPDVVYRGRVIDDLAITISSITIDGSGGVLGQSSPTAFRGNSDLPYLGIIQLDTADVASMQRDGSLLGVVEHEIAHVLGFGVIWSDLGLLVGANTSNPGFSGAHAVAEYNAIFGTNATAVPVESAGGLGTQLSHWDESVFVNELMTGWYNSGRANPISRITVASLADLGYQVNMAAADSYTRPVSSIAASAATATVSSHSYYSLGLASSDSVRPGRTDRLHAVDMIMSLRSDEFWTY
jgi:hypothetical protein